MWEIQGGRSLVSPENATSMIPLALGDAAVEGWWAISQPPRGFMWLALLKSVLKQGMFQVEGRIEALQQLGVGVDPC